MWSRGVYVYFLQVLKRTNETQSCLNRWSLQRNIYNGRYFLLVNFEPSTYARTIIKDNTKTGREHREFVKYC